MTSLLGILAITMLPASGGDDHANTWKRRVPPAMERARREATTAARAAAFEAAYRADDWRAARTLAQTILSNGDPDPKLSGSIVRALWRGGRIEDAEKIAARIPPNTRDPLELVVSIQVHLARGEIALAGSLADRLEALPPATAEQLFMLLSVRQAQGRMHGIAALVRRAAHLLDPAHGYPESYLKDMIDGMPKFFDVVGDEPLNQVTALGAVDMPVLGGLHLPYCEAIINGKGPYRLIVDTGGSIALSLDADIAAEIGLESIATAPIQGVSGKAESGQAIVQSVGLGNIACKRVMTRIFELPVPVDALADGILGTGVFSTARVTLDFSRARLAVSKSSKTPAAGRAAPLRIVADGKLLTFIEVEGRRVTALLDSGADLVATSPSLMQDLFPQRELKPLPGAGLGVGQGGGPGVMLAPPITLKLWGRTHQDYGGLAVGVLDELLSPYLGVQADTLVGMPLLREVESISIDYPRSRLMVRSAPSASSGIERD